MMEKKFKELSDPDDNDMFMNFSRSMQDIAAIFKVNKKEKSVDKSGERGNLFKKKNFKRNQHEISKMIFGVGMTPPEVKNKTLTFRILPTKLLGFSKVQ